MPGEGFLQKKSSDMGPFFTKNQKILKHCIAPKIIGLIHETPKFWKIGVHIVEAESIENLYLLRVLMAIPCTCEVMVV